jgi:translation elongation factor EF-1beta
MLSFEVSKLEVQKIEKKKIGFGLKPLHFTKKNPIFGLVLSD